MGGKAITGHQIWPVPGTLPGCLSSLLAEPIISLLDLLGSPIPWQPTAASITAHVLYLLF